MQQKCIENEYSNKYNTRKIRCVLFIIIHSFAVNRYILFLH